MKDKIQKPEKIVPQEWPYIINSDDVVSKPMRLTISPDELQKKALCKRMALVAIDMLSAELELERNPGNRIIHVRGRLRVHLKQKCIVSLEPVEESIDEEFEGWFADPLQAVSFAKAKRERLNPQDLQEQPILEEQEDPEPIIDGKIDLGEFTAQFFSLSLNPYPRAAGSEFASAKLAKEDEPEGIYDNPFAALKDWKVREQKKDK